MSESKPTTYKNVCEIKFTQEKGEQYLYVKVIPEVEAIFKHESTQTSNVYASNTKIFLTYYILKSSLSQMQEKFNNYSRNGCIPITLNNYGSELMRNSYANLSILRTVNISKGVTLNISDLIIEKDLENWVNSLKQFIEFLCSYYMVKKEIKVSITIEA